MTERPPQVEDATGFATLEAFSEAEKFNQWIYHSIAGDCSGRIMEIGSGIGNISALLLKNATEKVTLSDLRNEYCEVLHSRFDKDPLLGQILQIDLSVSDFSHQYADQIGRFDTVIALNVIEHIKDDLLAIQHCKMLLKPGGTVIILVPAFQKLFNQFDKELGHYRRYSRKSLSELMTNAGLHVKRTWYFNAAGISGWWLFGSVLKNKQISGKQLNLFNNLVPFWKLTDKIFSPILGLSVVVTAKK